MFTLKKVTKIYNPKSKTAAFKALDSIDLTIEEGEMVAIVGKSGSGKSTLTHILGLLDKATSGELVINGKDVSKMKEKELANLRNKDFGFVFQQFFLLPKQTVLDNVILPLKIGGVGAKQRKQLAIDAIKEVDLADKINAKAQSLSGGQKQRVAIARALVGKPKVIFADEPTGALDTVNAANVIDILFELNKRLGTTIVVVTHDLETAKKFKRQIHIKDGKIEA
jgi:putative ABC transport system ATP-binding protein